MWPDNDTGTDSECDDPWHYDMRVPVGDGCPQCGAYPDPTEVD